LGSRRCRRCLITFPDSAFAARHAKRQHPQDFAAAALRGALFVCFVCARPFGCSAALLRHQRAHAGTPGTPGTPGHGGTAGHAHLAHLGPAIILAHPGTPPPEAPPPAAWPGLACTECGRSFSREGALHGHYIRHARGEL
ncbi:ZN576 protein, partial [Xiphorhynchus elegans]|nr:ZN576 protein [Xiphorhynchus elegans]